MSRLDSHEIIRKHGANRHTARADWNREAIVAAGGKKHEHLSVVTVLTRAAVLTEGCRGYLRVRLGKCLCVVYDIYALGGQPVQDPPVLCDVVE